MRSSTMWKYGLGAVAAVAVLGVAAALTSEPAGAAPTVTVYMTPT